MRTCAGCGGVLGRDCWNEQDCIQISRFDEMHNQQELDFLRGYVEYLEQELTRNNIPFLYSVPFYPTPIKPAPLPKTCEPFIKESDLPF